LQPDADWHLGPDQLVSFNSSDFGGSVRDLESSVPGDKTYIVARAQIVEIAFKTARFETLGGTS